MSSIRSPKGNATAMSQLVTCYEHYVTYEEETICPDCLVTLERAALDAIDLDSLIAEFGIARDDLAGEEDF